MNNALVATIKSILHTSKQYRNQDRVVVDTIARSIADFIIANGPALREAYTGDEAEVVETFTRDYLAELS